MFAECLSILLKQLILLIMVVLPLSISMLPQHCEVLCSDFSNLNYENNFILSVHLRHLIFSNFASSCTREGLDWISDWMIGKITSLKVLSKHWRLSRGAVESPTLKVSKRCVDRASGDMVQWWTLQFWVNGWTLISFLT